MLKRNLVSRWVFDFLLPVSVVLSAGCADAFSSRAVSQREWRLDEQTRVSATRESAASAVSSDEKRKHDNARFCVASDANPKVEATVTFSAPARFPADLASLEARTDGERRFIWLVDRRAGTVLAVVAWKGANVLPAAGEIAASLGVDAGEPLPLIE